jgi:hypothetical protein
MPAKPIGATLSFRLEYVEPIASGRGGQPRTLEAGANSRIRLFVLLLGRTYQSRACAETICTRRHPFWGPAGACTWPLRHVFGRSRHHQPEKAGHSRTGQDRAAPRWSEGRPRRGARQKDDGLTRAAGSAWSGTSKSPSATRRRPTAARSPGLAVSAPARGMVANVVVRPFCLVLFLWRKNTTTRRASLV